MLIDVKWYPAANRFVTCFSMPEPKRRTWPLQHPSEVFMPYFYDNSPTAMGDYIQTAADKL